MLSCGGKKFLSLAELLKHYNTDHFDENRQCVFEQCDVWFTRKSASRHHFRLKHLNTGKLNLKEKHSDQNHALEYENLAGNVLENSFSDHNTEDEYLDEDRDCEIETEEMEGDPIHFKSAHADFLIRMSCSKFVPFMTMKIISKEYLSQSMNSLQEREKVLRSSLSALPIVTAAQVDDVVHDVIYEDKFILAQKELDTEHKFMKYVREAFKFIEPVEVILNKKEVKLGKPKECFHYVPIVKAFRNLIEDETMIKLCQNAGSVTIYLEKIFLSHQMMF